jgi:hypothetical protein
VIFGLGLTNVAPEPLNRCFIESRAKTAAR